MSGGLTAFTEYGSFFILTHISENVLINNALSFILSLVVGFTLNKTWVFKVAGNQNKQLISYILLAFTNLSLSTLTIWTLVDVIGIYPLIAKVFVIGIVACSNYLLFSKLIFKDETQAK